MGLILAQDTWVGVRTADVSNSHLPNESIWNSVNLPERRLVTVDDCPQKLLEGELILGPEFCLECCKD